MKEKIFSLKRAKEIINENKDLFSALEELDRTGKMGRIKKQKK